VAKYSQTTSFFADPTYVYSCTNSIKTAHFV